MDSVLAGFFVTQQQQEEEESRILGVRMIIDQTDENQERCYLQDSGMKIGKTTTKSIWEKINQLNSRQSPKALCIHIIAMIIITIMIIITMIIMIIITMIIMIIMIIIT